MERSLTPGEPPVHVREVGWGKVRLLGSRQEPATRGLGHELLTLHWHGDTYDLPSGAVHLAATALCPHQAFRIGHHAYALQFHAEVDARQAATGTSWMPTSCAPRAARTAVDCCSPRRGAAPGRPAPRDCGCCRTSSPPWASPRDRGWRRRRADQPCCTSSSSPSVAAILARSTAASASRAAWRTRSRLCGELGHRGPNSLLPDYGGDGPRGLGCLDGELGRPSGLRCPRDGHLDGGGSPGGGG